MPIQQDKPNTIGRPPLFTSFTTSVCNPMAPIAIMIKNLDNSFNGRNTSLGTPTEVAIVVIRLAPMKKRMKKGKTFFKETRSPDAFSAFFVRINARTSVIGIIAKVLVSFTVTALSKVWLPR